MIIKGNARCDVGFWAGHLVRTDHNEAVRVVDVRGLSGQSVKECLAELDAIAAGTNTKNGFYVASLNPCGDEQLTGEQWEKAADIFERKMGLAGQPRFIMEHVQEGRTHRHGVWGRIDADTMKAIPADFNYQKHELAAREIEQELGLRAVESVLTKDRPSERPERRAKDWEGFRAADTGIDPQAMKAELTALWQSADNGLAFKAALEDAGYLLARGDRRDFCVIDPAGDEHSLARRISGVKAAQIRARMADVDRDALPSVAEGRQMARDAAAGGGGATASPEAAATADAPDLERDVAGRYDDWTAAPQGAPADWQPASSTEPQTVEAAPPGVPEAWQEAERGQASDRREPFTAWERFAGRMRAFQETAAEFWHDESSGAPEQARGSWQRLILAGRKLVMGESLREALRFGEGVDDAAPSQEGDADEIAPPEDGGGEPKGWVERVRAQARGLFTDERGSVPVEPWSSLEGLAEEWAAALAQGDEAEPEEETGPLWEPEPDADPEPDAGLDIDL